MGKRLCCYACLIRYHTTRQRAALMQLHGLRAANSISLYDFFQFVKERTALLIAKIKPKSRGVMPCRLGFVLCRLGSSCSRWWRLTGSNRRPPACKAGALPAELNPRGHAGQRQGQGRATLVGLVGFEPTTPALSTRCSNQLSYRPATTAAALHAWAQRP